MTYVQKIIRDAKSNGKTIDKDIVRGLRAIEKMHEIAKSCKSSPSKFIEESHRVRK